MFPHTWTNGSGQPINAEALTEIEAAIVALQTHVNPARLVYASQAGCVLDAVADDVGVTGTDNTTALNAILAGGNVRLIIDGPCAADYLIVESNTIIEGLTRSTADGLFKIGLPNTGRPLIRNKNLVTGPTLPTDMTITLRNLYLDGNRRGYGSGNTGTVPAWTDPAYRAYVNDSGYVIPTVGMFGVDGVFFDNVWIHNSPCYGFGFSNVQRAVFREYRKTRVSSDPYRADDGFHLNGYCSKIKAFSLYIETLDDAIALNSDDGDELASAGVTTATFEPGTVAHGPIDDVQIYGVIAPACLDAVRFLSARQSAGITNVIIQGVDATCAGTVGGYGGVYCDTFGVVGDSTYGLLDNITLRDFTIKGAGGAGLNLQFCNIGSILLDNFRSEMPNAPLVYMQTNTRGIAGHLLKVVRGWANNAPAIQIINDAPINVDVIEPNFDMAAYSNSPAIVVAGNGGRIAVRGGLVAGAANVIGLTGTTSRDIIVGGMSHVGAKGGPTILADTAMSSILHYGLNADIPVSAPAGSLVKSDGMGWYTTSLARDFFAGSPGSLLNAHVSDSGATWTTDMAGAGALKIQNGGVFLGGGDSVNYLPDAVQPSSGNFGVEFDHRQLTSGPTDILYVTLFTSVNLSDYVAIGVREAGLSLVQMGGTLLGPTAPPTVGTTNRVRVDITSVSTTRTIRVRYSLDGGRTWQLAFKGNATTSAAPRVGIYASGAGYTGTTGPQVAALSVRE